MIDLLSTIAESLALLERQSVPFFPRQRRQAPRRLAAHADGTFRTVRLSLLQGARHKPPVRRPTNSSLPQRSSLRSGVKARVSTDSTKSGRASQRR